MTVAIAAVDGPLRSLRLGSGTKTTSGLGLSDAVGIAGGIGSLLSIPTGAGSVLGLFSSSRRLKTEKAPVDDQDVLEVVERMPVETWRYKDGLGLDSEKRHIGPYAEDLQTLGLSDGVTINPVDVAGLGLAAIKGLARKVERLEHSLGLADAASKAPANDGGRVSLGLAAASASTKGLCLIRHAVSGPTEGLGLAKATNGARGVTLGLAAGPRSSGGLGLTRAA